MSSISLLYRIVVIGGGGVGKSCLTLQFVANRFVEDYDPTLEDSYRRQATAGGEPCIVEILDTAGQDDYAVIREAYYRTGDGFIFVFDVTSMTSLLEVISMHEAILETNKKSRVPAVLVGNKADLVNHRVVSKREGEELALRMGCKYVEASAKELDHVNEVFSSVLDACVEERKKERLKNLEEPGLEELNAWPDIKKCGRWGRKRSIVKKKLKTCLVM